MADEYPAEILTAQSAADQEIQTEFPALKLLAAGAVSPHQLRDEILQHPLIQYVQAKINRIETTTQPELFAERQFLGKFDHIVVCTARDTQQFFENYPVLKPIRGQVSWVNNQHQPLNQDTAYSYGGYCMQLNPEQLILGASFYPGRDDAEVLVEDHVHNYELIHSVFPEYAQLLPSTETWQGRAAVRAQSQDYFPLLGKINVDQEVYSFAGLGSKGFLFAPLCSEILAAQILGEACPAPSNLVKNST